MEALEAEKRKDALREEIMKYYGLGYYNSPSNICWHDSWCAQCIIDTYTKDEIHNMILELSVDYDIKG